MNEQAPKGEEPKSLFDVLVNTAVSKFKSKEFYLGGSNGDEKFAYHLPCAVKDAIEEFGDPITIFKELVRNSDLRFSDIESYRVTLERAPEEESWEDILNVLSGIILQEEVVKQFPALYVESERRWIKYEEEESDSTTS